MRSTNPTFNDLEIVSRKQVELAFFIRAFRRINNMSQKEMADLCSCYGVHFDTMDISRYENYKAAPTMPKFQILMKTMHITPHDLR